MSDGTDRGATRRLVSAGALMASGTMISRVLGFVRVALLASVLANGTRQADAYAVATMVPTGLYILFAGGALNTVLVPQLVRAAKNDPDGGEAYTNRIITAFLLIIAVVTVLITVAAPVVAWIYSDDSWRAPAVAQEYQALLLLTYLCLPEVFFYGAFYLLGQVLNARDRFGPMMWAPIANNIVQIGVLGVYLGTWGTQGGRPFELSQLLLLGGGHLFGIILQAGVMVWALHRIGYRYRPRFDLKGTGLGRTFHLAKWTLGFVLVNQIVLAIITRLATSATAGGHGAGATAYNNAYLIFVLPHSLITVSLATAMLPSASRLAAEGNLGGVARETTRTIKLTTTLLLPAAFAFATLAHPMARLLFGQGAGAADSKFVAWTLIAFAVGLVPFTVQYVCLRAFYALEDTRATFVQQCLIAAVNVVLALILVLPRKEPQWVAPSLALAYSVSYLIGLVVTFRRLRKRLPELTAAPVVRHLARVGLAILPGALLAGVIGDRLGDSVPQLVFGLLLAGVVAVGVFLGLARLLRIEEVTSMFAVLRRRGTQAKDSEETAVRPDADDDTSIRPLSEDVDTSIRPLSEDDDTSIRSLSEERSDESRGFDSLGLAQPTEPGVPALAQPNDEFDQPTVLVPIASEQDEDTAEEAHPIRVRPGRQLGGRYRLEEVLIRRASTQTWRAIDEVLSRPVLIHLLPPGEDTDDLLETARRAAMATDSRFLRVLDAAVPTPADDPEDAEPDEALGPYIVSEYAAGQSLQELLASGPLSALEAAWLVREVADALTGMHLQGLFHQRISPDTVIVTATGNLKIVGFLLEAELAPSHHEIAAGQEPETVDVMDLGRLLYCTLVSRWPGGYAYGMAAAPTDAEGRILTPRQVRAGVSPALDRVCDQILSDAPRQRAIPLRTAAEVAQELSRVLGSADAAHDLERRMRYPVEVVRVEGTEPPIPAPPTDVAESARSATDPDAPTGAYRPVTPQTPDDTEPTIARMLREPVATPRREENRQWLGWLIALVLLVLVGSLIAVALQRTPQGPAGPPTQSGPATPTRWQVVAATDFDPQGDDRRENEAEVPRSFDNNPATAWRTVNYRQAAMGSKDGLGIVFDLGEVRPITRAELDLVGQPTRVELRIPADRPEAVTVAPMDNAGQWRKIVDTRATATAATLAAAQPVRSRFVLIYLTELPPDGASFRGGIAEARFFG